MVGRGYNDSGGHYGMESWIRYSLVPYRTQWHNQCNVWLWAHMLATLRGQQEREVQVTIHHIKGEGKKKNQTNRKSFIAGHKQPKAFPPVQRHHDHFKGTYEFLQELKGHKLPVPALWQFWSPFFLYCILITKKYIVHTHLYIHIYIYTMRLLYDLLQVRIHRKKKTTWDLQWRYCLVYN